MASVSQPQAPRSSRSRVLRTLRAPSKPTCRCHQLERWKREKACANPTAASTSERRSLSCTVPSVRLEDQRLELSGARSPALTVCQFLCLEEEKPGWVNLFRWSKVTNAPSRKLRCSTRTVPTQPPTKVVRCFRQSHVVPILDIKNLGQKRAELVAWTVCLVVVTVCPWDFGQLLHKLGQEFDA